MEESEEESLICKFIDENAWTCPKIMAMDLKLYYLDKFKKSVRLQRKTKSGAQAYTGANRVIYCATSLDKNGGLCEDPICRLRIPFAKQTDGLWKLAYNKRRTYLLHSSECMGSALLESRFDKDIASVIICRDGGSMTTLTKDQVSPELRKKGVRVEYSGIYTT